MIFPRLARVKSRFVRRLETGRRTVVGSGPGELILHVTDRCTLRCAMCMNAADPVSWPREGVHVAKSEMTIEDLDALLDAYPTVRSISFAGVGEPLLAGDIEAMAREAKRRGLRTSLISNGTEFERHAHWLTSGVVDLVQVSVNATDDVGLRDVCGAHGAVTFERLSDALATLAAARAQTGRPDSYEMTSVLWKGRQAEAASLVRLAARHGLSTLHFHSLIPSSKEGFGREQMLGPEDLGWLHDLVEAGREAGVQVCLPRLLDRGRPRRVCPSPWRVLYVDADGGVSGCFRVEAPSVANGDWRAGAVWNGPYFVDLRRRHQRGSTRDLPERCNDCVETYGR